MTPYGTPQLLDALQAALAEAERLGGSYGICLVDDGGHVLLHVRQPEATVAAADSALTKARTAAWIGADTGVLPPTASVVPALAAGVPWPLAVFAGGLVLRAGGRIVGGVGVGGSTDPAQDLAVARAAHAVLAG
ncbi:MAG TPA: heme-binding protein [Mycobacteriales bacterium]